MATRTLRQRGFAFISLLIVLALMALAASATVMLGVVAQRRAAEDALLEIGHEFQQALGSYISSTPAGQPMYPNTLQDLLKDPRTPLLRRHLRKLYADPMTGNSQWALIPSPAGQGFQGVHSLSPARPIRLANFDSEFIGFEGRTSYREWPFVVAAPGNAILDFSN
ncbi:type II secretion system protein [Actimicrobium antarcticum]|uniref:Type II secretion system protein n=1 Tax=Actimicrobium antarcticum TaxID=1051899 RepID=A0ABP7TSX3_9BURK